VQSAAGCNFYAATSGVAFLGVAGKQLDASTTVVRSLAGRKPDVATFACRRASLNRDRFHFNARLRKRGLDVQQNLVRGDPRKQVDDIFSNLVTS
jgi:hypothetical protein